MARDVIQIEAPVGGLNRSMPYRNQPPFTSVRMNNVRSFDVIEGRGRIGSRPGLVKAFQQPVTGSQLVVNGGFDVDANWTKSGSWTITGGKAVFSSLPDSRTIEATTPPLVIGTIYRMTYDVTITSGSGPLVAFPGGVSGPSITASGTYSQIFTAISTALSFTASSAFVGNLDNVSIYPYYPVRLASVIRTFNQTGTVAFTEPFNATPMGAGNWTAGTFTVGGVASTSTLPTVATGTGLATIVATTSAEARAAVLTGITDISTTAFREVSIELGSTTPADSEFVSLYLDLNSGITLSESSGIVLELTTASGNRSMALYVHGVLVYTRNFVGAAVSTWAVLSIDESNVIRMTFEGVTAEYTAANYTPPTAPRVGFALRKIATTTAQDCDIASFSLSYTSTSGGMPPEAAVFSANHLLYREAVAGTLVQVTSPGTVNLASATRLYAASRLEKLYIADYELFDSGTDGKVNGTNFDDAANQDWRTIIPLTPTTIRDSSVVEVLSVGTGTVAVLGVYGIASVAANGTSLTLSASAGGDGTNAAVKYRVVRYPKVYDAAENTLNRVGLGTVGTSQFPAGCRSFSLWQDRLVACNDPNTPHGYWMSAAGDPTDWNYYLSGTGSTIDAAISGTQSEFAGLIGEPLVTTIPINDDLLVFACRTSFYYLRGNPRAGGQFNNISREIGIVGIGAWCQTPDGRLIVLTPDGLYEITTDKAGSLSREVLPKELVGLTDDRYEIALAYDVARRGIIISAVGRDVGMVGICYLYDQRTGAFLPQSVEQIHDPTAMVTYQPGGIGMPTVLFGSRDGYVRKFEDSSANDDGVGFSSNVFFGPIRLGPNDDLRGIIHKFTGVLDAASGSVNGYIYVGDTVQAALASTAVFTFVLGAGRNYSERPRLGGNVVFIELRGIPSIAWVYESGTMERETVGLLRKV